jgi:BirA family transcriptional regulator, biotin operon repressor / biotin---[acetyl-CoA-carboxylase] ligase
VRCRSEVERLGFRLTSLDATASTNDDALAAARQGDPGRLWVVARAQTAGRGRQGRPWTSPAGNLHASLLLVEPCEPSRAAQLGFLAGLALHEAVSEAAGIDVPRLALKWPNDLLLDGAKVAGLLLEGHRLGPARIFAVVIGFGVNVATAPAGTPYPAAALRSLAPGLTSEDLFVGLVRALAPRLERWRLGSGPDPAEGFAPVRREWLRRAAGLGGPVTVRLPSGERSGRFAGLDRIGRLELQTEAGLEPIDAGDLFFPHLRTGPGLRPAAPAR